MSPFKHDVSDVIREKPDQSAKDKGSSGLIADTWDWAKNNIINPVHNTAWAQPVNALRNIVNPVSKAICDKEAISHQDNWKVKAADSIGITWAVQNISSGLGAMVPYVIAGKVTGGSLRAGSRFLQTEGRLATVLVSEKTAMIAGAAAYDALRDPNKGETRFSNAVGGAAAFAIIGKGNEMAAARNSFVKSTAFRIGAGALGADVQVVVGDLAQGKLPDKNTVSKLGDATVGGGSMNVLLPWAHGKFSGATDRVNLGMGRGLQNERFIQQEGLTGSKFSRLHADLERNSNVRIQYSHENSPKFRKNIINVDERIVDATAKIRHEQELAKATPDKPARSYDEIRQEALAAEIRAELGDIEAGKAGKAGSALSNRDIVKALKDGRLQVSLPTEVNGNTEYKPVPFEQLLPQIGTNTLDLTLGDTFVFLPKGRTIDLGKEHPADFLRTLPVERHPEGIELKPGDFVLAFSKEKITLPSDPEAHWNGEPPLKGRINVQSSLARLGIPENITAPEINNNTNNPITHEIKNNGDVTVRLVPGMRFGSIVFERLSGPPGMGFQQSRMHGQEKPNGAQGPAPSIEAKPHHLNGSAKVLTDRNVAPALRELPNTTSDRPAARVSEHQPGSSAEQFSQQMDGLRRAYSESLRGPDAPEHYRRMQAAERAFAEDTLRTNPAEWDKYLNKLKSDPSRQSEYIQALHTERAVMCGMDVVDLVKIPDSSRVHDALKLLNDPTKASAFRDAITRRRVDLTTINDILDGEQPRNGRDDRSGLNGQPGEPTRNGDVNERREPTRNGGTDEQMRASVAEFTLPERPATPDAFPKYLEDMRNTRDQLYRQGQNLTAMESVITAAEREFAAHALKTNPRAWYEYMSSLERNPARMSDYLSSIHTEKFVLQRMEPVDLLLVEGDRVMRALSAMNDKTKLSEWMRLSSDSRYTLSDDALHRIHDEPPASYDQNDFRPVDDDSYRPESTPDFGSDGFFSSNRPRRNYDPQWIRDIIRQRRMGDLNGGMFGSGSN